MHKSGFVNILGRPNAGKSTLLNALLGEEMVIVSPKPQTTRHRIHGFLSGEDYQIVFSDTPGIIDEPAYRMQEAMAGSIAQTFEDADLILYLVTPDEKPEEHTDMLNRLATVDIPKFLLLNKIDTTDPATADRLITQYTESGLFQKHFKISAKEQLGLDPLIDAFLSALPEGPVYYPKDQMSDRHERFFVTEIIREKILALYHQEIPYSCEVSIEEYREGEGNAGYITHIRAIIYVNRKSQKPILIGKGGSAIKELGIAARGAIEKFLDARVHLELFVKVRENWRDDERSLKEFGYQ